MSLVFDGAAHEVVAAMVTPPPFPFPKAYSAVLEQRDKGKSSVERRRLTTDGKNARIEWLSTGAIQIYRTDRHKKYYLLQGNFYSVEWLWKNAVWSLAPGKGRWSLLRESKVAGVRCLVYQAMVPDAENPGKLMPIVYAMDKVRNVPVRMDINNGESVIDYTSVKVGQPDASMFEVPPNFKRWD